METSNAETGSSQIINFVTYQEKDKPYPFSELPKVKGKK